MEPNNYFPMGSNNYNTISEYQTIGTQIESDGNWNQFWREYDALNNESSNNISNREVYLPNHDVDIFRPLETQQYTASENVLPPSPLGQFHLPEYGSDMFIPSYIDPTLISLWVDTYPYANPLPFESTSTSTSNSSPSATSSQKSSPSSNTSTPTTTSSCFSSSSFSTPTPTSSSSTPTSSTSTTDFSSTDAYTCQYCPSKFPKQCLLNRHTNTHTKPYACPYTPCTARRATNRDLKRHMAVHEPGVAARFYCEVRGCEFGRKGGGGGGKGGGFKRKDHLKRHVEVVHCGGDRRG